MEAGIRYGFPLSGKFSAFADLGLGLNMDLGHGTQREGHAIVDYFPNNGQPIDWSLGLSYANFGLVEVEGYQRLYASNFATSSEIQPEMMASSASGRDTMVLSSLSLRLGYIF